MKLPDWLYIVVVAFGASVGAGMLAILSMLISASPFIAAGLILYWILA